MFLVANTLVPGPHFVAYLVGYGQGSHVLNWRSLLPPIDKHVDLVPINSYRFTAGLFNVIFGAHAPLCLSVAAWTSVDSARVCPTDCLVYAFPQHLCRNNFLWALYKLRRRS